MHDKVLCSNSETVELFDSVVNNEIAIRFLKKHQLERIIRKNIFDILFHNTVILMLL